MFDIIPMESHGWNGNRALSAQHVYTVSTTAFVTAQTYSIYCVHNYFAFFLLLLLCCARVNGNKFRINETCAPLAILKDKTNNFIFNYVYRNAIPSVIVNARQPCHWNTIFPVSGYHLCAWNIHDIIKSIRVRICVLINSWFTGLFQLLAWAYCFRSISICYKQTYLTQL